MTMVFCKKCGAPIGLRSTKFGDKIPKKYRKKMKPVYEGWDENGKSALDRQLCADCEEKKESAKP